MRSACSFEASNATRVRRSRCNSLTDLRSRHALRGRSLLSLRLASLVIHSTTRPHVRLLGPCFKTGRVGPDQLLSARDEQCEQTPARSGHDRRDRSKKRHPEIVTNHENVQDQIPCIDSPVGRRVLLRPDYYWRSRSEFEHRHRLTTVDRAPEPLREHQENRPFRPSRAHSFNPLDGFTHSFNSLFKVLFNFPSRYLFSIGLAAVFSLRRSLPPA